MRSCRKVECKRNRPRPWLPARPLVGRGGQRPIRTQNENDQMAPHQTRPDSVKTRPRSQKNVTDPRKPSNKSVKALKHTIKKPVIRRNQSRDKARKQAKTHAIPNLDEKERVKERERERRREREREIKAFG